MYVARSEKKSRWINWQLSVEKKGWFFILYIQMMKGMVFILHIQKNSIKTWIERSIALLDLFSIIYFKQLSYFQ